MNKVKLFFLSISTALLSLVPVTGAVVVHAAIADDIRTGACSASDDSATCEEDKDGASSQAGVQNLIKRAVKILSIIVGAVSVIMIIIGGFKYITSGGESGGVTGAKNTILYALIGLVVILFANLLVSFVVGQVAPDSSAP